MIHPAMSGYWLDIALVGALVLVNAVFAGSEMALVSLREGQLRQLERSGDARGQRLVRLARDPNRFLATIQIGITLAGFLASATAAVSLAEPLVPRAAFLGSAAEPVVVAVVTLVLAFITLVLGELAPKRLAMQLALPWALAVARPLDLLSTLSRPAVAVLGASTDLVVRLFGGRSETPPRTSRPRSCATWSPATPRWTPSSARSSAARSTCTSACAARAGAARLGAVAPQRPDRGAGPRGDGRCRALARAGHRGHHLDRVLGIVHWGSVVDGDDDLVGSRVQPALMLPDTVRLSDALRRFREERQQMAIVVDEHGSVDGIVTLEDLLEEVVGEIWDETDPDLLGAGRGPDGILTLPGTFPVHDLPDLDVDLGLPPSADYSTVAGLVLKELGRVPQRPGDAVEVGDWTIEVTAVARRAVTELRLVRTDGR